MITGVDNQRRHQSSGALITSFMITAVIGSGVLSLCWAVSQLGFLIGLPSVLLFSAMTYFTSTLVTSLHPSPHHLDGGGETSCKYEDVVRENLGRCHAVFCVFYQYLNIFEAAIGCAIYASQSTKAIQCLHSQRQLPDSCLVPSYSYKIVFGVLQAILAQIPSFTQIWWLSMVSTTMAFIYSTIILLLGILRIKDSRKIQGKMVMSAGKESGMQKIFTSFLACGVIIYAYTGSLYVLEIQDATKSSAGTMKKANLVTTIITTSLYMLSSCIGYAALGDSSPQNLIMAFRTPHWLLYTAHLAIVIYNIGAYQLYCHLIFVFVEKTASQRYPNSRFINQHIPIPKAASYTLNPFRVVSRCVFVILTTIISVFMPSSLNGAVRVVGVIGLWRLSVHYPISIHLRTNGVPKWTPKWIFFRVLSIAYLIISLAAVVGSVANILHRLKWVSY